MTLKSKLPHTNSYLVQQGLIAGEYPGAKTETEARERLRSYVDTGVTYFLDLTKENELQPYAQLLSDKSLTGGRTIGHKRMPIADLDVPTEKEMVAILDQIDTALKQRHVVYVHCWGGVGRTGTVIGCHLVRNGLTGTEALDKLASMWKTVAKYNRKPDSPETDKQRAMVQTWSEHKRKKLSSNAAQSLSSADRYRGCLVGLAVGDAVGTTLEFKAPGSFDPIDDMVGGGPFNLKPGQWTDDTSMALCLASSLVERRGFDAKDQMERYVKWRDQGYMSSTGHCFDIGTTVNGALEKFERDGNHMAGSTDPNTAGNGSLMRLAPVPMFYAQNAVEAIERSGESSRTTHGAQMAVDACRYYGGLIVGALNGIDKETLLSPRYCPVAGYWDKHPLHPAIKAIADGSFKTKNPPAIRGTGYVVDSLEAALWAFYSAAFYRDAILLAANLGDDSDTTSAICGQLAGAFWGIVSIPTNWVELLARKSLILSLADGLREAATSGSGTLPTA